MTSIILRVTPSTLYIGETRCPTGHLFSRVSSRKRSTGSHRLNISHNTGQYSTPPARNHVICPLIINNNFFLSLVKILHFLILHREN